MAQAQLFTPFITANAVSTPLLWTCWLNINLTRCCFQYFTLHPQTMTINLIDRSRFKWVGGWWGSVGGFTESFLRKLAKFWNNFLDSFSFTRLNCLSHVYVICKKGDQKLQTTWRQFSKERDWGVWIERIILCSALPGESHTVELSHIQWDPLSTTQKSKMAGDC